jgi:hypothetical protein
VDVRIFTCVRMHDGYVCVYVCMTDMYVCMYPCIRVYACVDGCAYVCMYVHTYIFKLTRTYPFPPFSPSSPSPCGSSPRMPGGEAVDKRGRAIAGAWAARTPLLRQKGGVDGA